MKEEVVRPVRGFRGKIRVPGDKSVSHRSLLFGALAEGVTEVSGLLDSADVRSTASCLRAMGVRIEECAGRTGGTLVKVHGVGLRGLRAPSGPLDCGNSGTTIRLLMGVLAAQDFSVTLTGDASLSRRPMKRVAAPLVQMGARIELTGGERAPLTVTGARAQGGELRAIDYELPVASAQLKSAVLLAGLAARGTTRLRGEIHSRDHTERMFPYFGASLEADVMEIRVHGGSTLSARPVQVPGDPSTAAFWMAAAALVPGAEVTLEGVSLNPTRLGFLDVLRKMGAEIEVKLEVREPEPMGSVRVRPPARGMLRAVQITEAEVPRLIDELPLLAVLAASAEGRTVVHGARELRVKESDRIEAVARGLRALGVAIETFDDGFAIEGPIELQGGMIESEEDHRIAMAFSIGALRARGAVTIRNAECVAISYPGFYEDLRGLVVE